jgi:hypothetical protein
MIRAGFCPLQFRGRILAILNTVAILTTVHRSGLVHDRTRLVHSLRGLRRNYAPAVVATYIIPYNDTVQFVQLMQQR